MIFLADMIAEIQLAGEVFVRAAFRTLEMAEEAATVLFGLMLRILAEAFAVIAAADPVFFVIFINDIAGAVVDESDTLPAVFNVKSFFKILKFFAVDGSAYVKL